MPTFEKIRPLGGATENAVYCRDLHYLRFSWGSGMLANDKRTTHLFVQDPGLTR